MEGLRKALRHLARIVDNKEPEGGIRHHDNSQASQGQYKDRYEESAMSQGLFKPTVHFVIHEFIEEGMCIESIIHYMEL